MANEGRGRALERNWHPDFDSALLAPAAAARLPYAVGRDDKVPDFLWGSVLLLGNFDGLHIGHARLLAAARESAAVLRAPLAIMSCEPHPKEFFDPAGPPFRLSSGAAKRLVFGRLGIDLLYMPRFDADFAGLSAEAFATGILLRQLGVRAVVAGADFRFGKGRGGSVADLVAFGEAYDFGVTVVDDVVVEGERISSTRIRGWIAEGALDRVAQALGDKWLTRGEIDADGAVRFDRRALLPVPGCYEADVWTVEGDPVGRFAIDIGAALAKVECWSGSAIGCFLLNWRCRPT